MVQERLILSLTDSLPSQEIGEVGKARLEEIRLAVADGQERLILSLTDSLLSQEIGEVGKACLEEIRLAVADGAREIDIVINRQLALTGDWTGR